MVKRFLSMFAIASMMLATSCTNDEFDSIQAGNEATVSFTVKLPDGLQTKSYGNGQTAKKLQYVVYNEDWSHNENLDGETTFTDLQTSVNLPLVNGKTYNIVFWASAGEASPYTFDAANAKVSVDYTNSTSNDDACDAFFAVKEITVPGAASNPVELKRPFAQLNIGTADLEKAAAAGVNVEQAGIAVSAYTSFDFKIQDVAGESKTVVFGLGKLPTPQEETFPVEGYKYLTMNYLLMPADKQTVDVTLNCDNVKSQKFSNVPLQRNYRTNIYGNLLTHNEDFIVEINPGFDDDHNKSVWDGTSVDEPTLVDDTYQISKASEWIWIVKNGIDTKNISLTSDIDFGGQEIGSVALLGTFDGNGHIMSNMAYVNNGREAAAGMFSVPNVAGQEIVTIKNVTIKGAQIDSYYVDNRNTYGYAGVVIGCLLSGQDVTLDGVTVENADVKGIQSVGGLVGIVSGSKLTVKNSSVKNSDIKNYSVNKESGYVATLVGKCAGTVKFGENVASSNNKLVGIYAGESNNRPEASINEIAALRAGTIDGAESVATNNNEIIKVPYGATIISTAEELVAFANEVNNNGNTYAGKTIVIVSDIDLNGISWQPVGQTGGTDFCGVMEGNGYTIHNLTINHYAATSGHATGFFGWIDNAAVRDLNFENANVTGAHYVGVICGYNQFGEISNCKVTNSKVNARFINSEQDGDKCGGAIGVVGASSGAVKDIVVTNTAVSARRNAAQVIGYLFAKQSIISNLSANNVTVEYNGDKFDNKDGSGILNELYGYKKVN